MKFRRRERLLTKSPIVKRSLRIDGRNTSVTLEDGFWNALKEIAGAQSISTQELVLQINRARKDPNLSSAIRLFVLDYCRNRTTAGRSQS